MTVKAEAGREGCGKCRHDSERGWARERASEQESTAAVSKWGEKEGMGEWYT